MNALDDWRLDPAAITTTGHGLRRPECVLADHDGSLWVADLGGILRIAPDGGQSLLRPDGGGPWANDPADISGNAGHALPNGLCFDGDEGFIVADFGTNGLWWLGRDGRHALICDTVDGRPLGKANFPALDSSGRLWFSVTASAEDWARGDRTAPSGYIATWEHGRARIVADQLVGTNELRFHDDWLYVAETGADHITRFRVGPDATLSGREIYGPAALGGAPDGFAFDAAGNIWITLIVADRLIVLTPAGEVRTIWQDGDPSQRAGLPRTLGPAAGDGLAPRMASVTFAGDDRRTVHVGSLLGTTLPTFRAPVAGAPLPRRRWRR